MFSLIPLVITLTLSTQIQDTEAYGGMFDVTGGSISTPVNNMKLFALIEQEKRDLERANHLWGLDSRIIRKEKEKELRSIKAILKRYSSSFETIKQRHLDRHKEKGHVTITASIKVKNLFKTELWEYNPNDKGLDSLVKHIYDSFYNQSRNSDEKVRWTKERIDRIKKGLVYFRDMYERNKEDRGWKDLNQFFYSLEMADIALAIHKNSKDWYWYNRVIKDLDEL